MAILKIITGKYLNAYAVDNLASYVLDPDKMPTRIFGGQGVPPQIAAQSMHIVKDIFCHGGKQAEHFVIAFNKEETLMLTRFEALDIAYAICEKFYGLQVLFGYHECSDDEVTSDCGGDYRIHVHFIINTSNVFTGKKHTWDRYEIYDLRNYVEALLSAKGISEKVVLTYS